MRPTDNANMKNPFEIIRAGPQTIYIPLWDVVSCSREPLFMKEDYRYYAGLGE